MVLLVRGVFRCRPRLCCTQYCQYRVCRCNVLGSQVRWHQDDPGRNCICVHKRRFGKREKCGKMGSWVILDTRDDRKDHPSTPLPGRRGAGAQGFAPLPHLLLFPAQQHLGRASDGDLAALHVRRTRCYRLCSYQDSGSFYRINRECRYFRTLLPKYWYCKS